MYAGEGAGRAGRTGRAQRARKARREENSEPKRGERCVCEIWMSMAQRGTGVAPPPPRGLWQSFTKLLPVVLRSSRFFLVWPILCRGTFVPGNPRRVLVKSLVKVAASTDYGVQHDGMGRCVHTGTQMLTSNTQGLLVVTCAPGLVLSSSR